MTLLTLLIFTKKGNENNQIYVQVEDRYKCIYCRWLHMHTYVEKFVYILFALLCKFVDIYKLKIGRNASSCYICVIICR